MLQIYTDASFRNTDNIGVIGFLFVDGETTDIHFQTIKEANNIRCELKAVLEALTFMTTRSGYVSLYTDCEAIAKLLDRRAGLEKKQFQSSSSGEKLANADLYQQFFALYDHVKPAIHWTKGHTSRTSQSTIERNFSVIDKAVRSQLRDIPVKGP